MPTQKLTSFHLCDVCDQPIDLCDCGECTCGKKILKKYKWCSIDCKQEDIDDHVRGDSSYGIIN